MRPITACLAALTSAFVAIQSNVIAGVTTPSEVRRRRQAPGATSGVSRSSICILAARRRSALQLTTSLRTNRYQAQAQRAEA